MNWHSDIIRTADFFLRELGGSLPKLISVLLRLGLLYLFFWYLCSFSREMGHGYALLAVLLWLVVLLLIGWRLFRAAREFDLQKEAGSGGWAAYIYLNLLPVAAVGAATLYGHNFANGLLHFTQSVLKRLPGMA